MYAWTFLNCGLALLGMLPVVLAIDPLPNRVRRQIPTGGIRKWLAHPFYSGPDSSLIWGIALVILTLLPSTIRIAFFDIPPEERHGEILFSYLIGFLLIVGILLKMPALLQNTGPKDSRSTIQMKFFRFAVFTAAIVVGVWLVAASLEEHGRLKLEEIPFLAEILITAFVLFVTIQVWQSRRWFVQRWKEFTPVDG